MKIIKENYSPLQLLVEKLSRTPRNSIKLLEQLLKEERLELSKEDLSNLETLVKKLNKWYNADSTSKEDWLALDRKKFSDQLLPILQSFVIAGTPPQKLETELEQIRMKINDKANSLQTPFNYWNSKFEQLDKPLSKNNRAQITVRISQCNKILDNLKYAKKYIIEYYEFYHENNFSSEKSANNIYAYLKEIGCKGSYQAEKKLDELIKLVTNKKNYANSLLRELDMSPEELQKRDTEKAELAVEQAEKNKAAVEERQIQMQSETLPIYRIDGIRRNPKTNTVQTYKDATRDWKAIRNAATETEKGTPRDSHEERPVTTKDIIDGQECRLVFPNASTAMKFYAYRHLINSDTTIRDEMLAQLDNENSNLGSEIAKGGNYLYELCEKVRIKNDRKKWTSAIKTKRDILHAIRYDHNWDYALPYQIDASKLLDFEESISGKHKDLGFDKYEDEPVNPEFNDFDDDVSSLSPDYKHCGRENPRF